jgi:hypothetical protein
MFGRVLAIATLMAALWGSAAAQDRPTRFGAKTTLLMPGEAYVEEFDAFFDIDMSFGVGGFVETRLGEKLLGGLYLDLLRANAYDESAMLVDLGFVLRATLGGRDGQPAWRPGFGLGYGTLAAVGAMESTHYLTLRGGVEALLPSGWLAEVAIHGAPTGGNDAVTVSYGPMVMMRVGRLF